MRKAAKAEADLAARAELPDAGGDEEDEDRTHPALPDTGEDEDDIHGVTKEGVSDGAGEGTVATRSHDDEEDEPNEIRVERPVQAVKHTEFVQSYCTLSGLLVNTEYHVQVRAQDQNGEWGEWAERLFDTPPRPPRFPTLKKAAPGLHFTWEAPDVFTSYVYCVEQSVERTTAAKKATSTKMLAQGPEFTEWKIVEVVAIPQCKIRVGAAALNKVRCRVKCSKMDRQEPLWSEYGTVVALASNAPPEPVAHLQVSSLSRTAATLEWTKATQGESGGHQPYPTGTVEYHVMLSAGGQPGSVYASTRQTSHDLPDLQPSTTYSVQVRVETDTGISSRNLLLKFTTKPEGDTTVSRTTSGGAPLGQLDDSALKLPSLAQQPRSSSTSRRDQVEMRHSQGGGSPKRGGSPRRAAPSHVPRPPQKSAGAYGGGSAVARRPHPPSRKRAGTRSDDRGDFGTGKASAPQPRSGSLKKRGTSASRHSRGRQTSARSHRHTSPQRTQLPQVTTKRGAPQDPSNAAMEEYDVVAFDPSDDEHDV